MATLDDDLRRVPLFSTLSGRQLRQLKKHFKQRTFRPGTTMLREGEMSGAAFFVIVDGAASVSARGEEIDRLGPGDHFGEIALILEQERAATVTAVEPTECL